MRKQHRIVVGWLVAGLVMVTGATAGTSAASAATDPVIVAAGDIACAPGSAHGRKCRDDLTAEKLAAADYVLTLGDNQYNCGQVSAYPAAYDKTWGVALAKTFPIVGEDEYSGSGCSTAGARGYFTYFQGRAQQGSCVSACKGWYSHDIGDWHVVALNTACDEPGVGGCSASSEQVRWLKEDLANNSKRCVLAQMHRPYWANGRTVKKFKPLVDALYAGGVDVLLTGNSHLYARYAPQNPSSQLDTANGIRAFIVGTGGKSHSTLQSPRLRNFEAGNDSTFGVLQLTLHPTSYDWKYLQAYPVTSQPFTDTGSTTCR